MFQLVKPDCECRKQHVQNCGAAAFDGLVLIKEGRSIWFLVLMGRRMTGVSLKGVNFIRKYCYAGEMILSRKWSEMPRDKVTSLKSTS